jgi:glucosamine--fructose-6-phosphate aminotransferase (isomerizing)
MHGPLRLVGPKFPVLAFLPEDAAAEVGRAGLARIAAAGAEVLTAAAGTAAPGVHLPVAATGHPYLDQLSMIVSFYTLVERVCRLRGFDPDRPANLRKVTETL